MTRDDFEAQFWRAVTETREGRHRMAVKRILDAAEQYAEGRADQVMTELIRARTEGRKRLAAAAAENSGNYRRTA